MKSLVWSLLLLPSLSFAGFQAKLDLNADFQAVGIREFGGGDWLVGIGKQITHLEYNGVETLHLGLFNAWRAGREDPAFGTSIGFNIGKTVRYFVENAVPPLINPAKDLANFLNLISLDFYGGYRFSRAENVAPWMYGIGGYVKIPLK